ncbi:MAG: hypothetical protein V4613_11640 [Bacteroidota bacterium]
MTLRLYLTLLIFTFFVAKGQPPAKVWSLGLDISQFNYLIGTGSKGFNAGVCGQYQPYRFLSINTSLMHNSVNYQRGKWYDRLEKYHSEGVCFKLGFDLSVKISKGEKNTRAFFGYQGMITRYKESGQFEIDNYWGKYTNTYETKIRQKLAREVIFGLQYNKKQWIIRPQIFSIFAMDDIRISPNDDIVKGYKSPFIPGFGFRRGGINLIVMYRLGKYR